MVKYLIYDTETVSENLNTDDINIHDHVPFMVSYVVADEHLNIIAQDYFRFNDNTKENIFKMYLHQLVICVTM